MVSVGSAGLYRGCLGCLWGTRQPNREHILSFLLALDPSSPAGRSLLWCHCVCNVPRLPGPSASHTVLFSRRLFLGRPSWVPT